MTSHSLLMSIAQELEQHQDAPRIKKLLIYTAENRWEGNPQQLQRFALEQVIQKIVLQFPMLDQLQQALDVAVSTLSRPAAYSRLASDILTRLSPLYEDVEDATQIVFSAPPVPQGPAISTLLIETIAHSLETSREGIRIKKLLYALCYQRWENNFQILGQTTFVQLIQQVATFCTTYVEFKEALDQLVASLNRQNTYTQIADFIGEAIAPLYGSLETSGVTRPMLTPPPFMELAPSVPTGSVADYKTTLETEKEDNTSPDLDYKGTIAINLEDQQFQKMLLEDVSSATKSVPTANTAQQVSTSAAPVTPPTTAPDHFAENINIYELKLEVMKYANPLRAKILLFSAIHHPFDLTGQDWSMLRTCDLDDLLRKILKTVPSIVALEIKLAAIAQSLFEADEHLQATSAIIQSLNILLTPPPPTQ